MPSLQEIQQAFKAAVLTDEAPDVLVSALNVGDIDAAACLQIHRNNYRGTLATALHGIFPVSEKFVGEQFLRGLLRQYVLTIPPEDAALSGYGQGVAEFVGVFAPAQKVPYLADVMALEWAVYDLQHAVEHALPADAELLGSADEGEPCISPNLRLIDSEFPVLNLWMAGTGQLPPEAVHANAGGQCACALLQQGEVKLFGLSAAQHALLVNVAANGAKGDNCSGHDFEHLVSMGLVWLSR